MIPRKKIQLLLCTLCILHTIGNEGYASAINVRKRTNETSVNSTASLSVDSSSNTTFTEDLSTHSVGSTLGNKSLSAKAATTVDFEFSTTTEKTTVDFEFSTTNRTTVDFEFSTTNTTTVDYEFSTTSEKTTADLESSTSGSTSNTSVDERVVFDENDTSTSTTIPSETTTQVDICADGVSVENLEVASGNTTLVVTWHPAASNDECILRYDIIWYTDDNVFATDLVNSTESHYTIRNLTSCTSYNVSVTAVGKNGDNATQTVQGTTADSIPGQIQDLTMVNTTGYSVFLTWSAPTLNPTCISSYKINIYNDTGYQVVTEINDLYYDATGLSPCLNYTFGVSVISKSGSSGETNQTAGTSHVTPSEPESLAIEPGQFSLFVSWDPPANGSTCVTSYRVNWWPDNNSSIVTNTNITIPDLTACEKYTVQIIAVTDQPAEGGPAMIADNTEESFNDPPTLVDNSLEVTKNSISITWLITRTMNKCELKYIHTTCNFHTTNGSGIDAVNGTSAINITSSGSSTNDTTVTITVNELSSFSSYNCTGLVENVAGNSEISTVVNAITSEDVPSAPTMNVSSIESTEFKLIWEKPGYLAGNLIEYEIFFTWEQVALMPSSCTRNNTSMEEQIPGIEGSMYEYPYLKATAYSNYTAKIRAKTNAGWGEYSDDISFQTASDVPGAVTNVVYSNTSSTQEQNVLDTFLSWQLPCSLNGKLEYFLITYHGVREWFPDDHNMTVHNDTESIDADKTFIYNFGELKAEYTYTFEIYAKVANVTEFGPAFRHTVTYPAGLPPWPQDWYMRQIKIDPYDIERTSSTTWILLPLFDNDNGEIKYYAIMISEVGQNFHSESRFDILSGDWPNETTWKEAMSHTTIVTYQATPIRWNPAITGHIQDYDGVRVVKFHLGETESCPELSSRFYCNGPLQPEKQYQVRMRAFTNGGYRDSQAIIVATKAEFNLGMVIGVVFGILFLGIITTMMLLVRKGVLQTVLSNILHRSAQGSPGPDPLPRKKFELHCQELIDNPGKLSNEFQLLQTLSVDLEMSTNAAELQANRKKNRYINILPYDISRVKLEVLNNDPNTDYINASFIQGYSGGTEYIACQGPKEETTYDFWRMIYEYNVKIIVMVTQLVEKGKDKCYQYYPNTRESFTHEDITIRCSTQLDFVFYTQRVITLQKEDNKRTVIHLHFKEWSDHGVPDDVHSMINFCQIIRKQINEYKSLAVVHCSAGVGRTGTLIAVDILLQQIKDNKKLDVFGTVYRLRQHRTNMVQTESQYAYIYDCTKQALNNPYPPKQYKTSSVEPVYENLTKKNREITDSNTNLVASAETLKKVSPSASSGSLDPICEISVPRRPVYTTQLSTLSLRYSKSTGAINSPIPPNLEFARYASHEYPVFEPAPDSPLTKANMDMHGFLEFTRPIDIERRIIPSESVDLNENTDHTIRGIEPNY